MKQSFVFHIIAVCFVLGITLAIFQFYKNENIHEYITPVVAENKDFTIMSGDGRNRQGEKLNVYIYQDKTELSQAVFTNLSYALTYAKVPFKPIMEKEIPSLTPSPYHVLVLTGENVDRWPYDVIRSFVEKGGRVIVTTPLSDAKWNELVGIEKNNGFDSDVSSLTFEETFFPGYPDITKETEFFEDTVLDVQLKKEAQVYITAHDTPILWTYPLKKGEVVYWNTTETIQKHFRGMLLQSISLATPAFVTSQVAAKVIFIDDFPSPVPEGKNELVTKHYHLSISDFYKQIWWEDMKGWGKEYDLTYTAAFVGTYRNDMKLDDADLVKKGRESMAFYGREVLENNGAIEFHGYNHQPLVTKQDPLDPALRYVPWESQEKMEQSLQRVQKFYDHYFPNQTFQTYVPPSNVLNQTGVEALHNALPHVHTIASLYVGDPKKGDFVQEFEWDKKYPELYHFPRITSDYTFYKDNRFIMNDAIANFGIVSHFIHPDDVLDPGRAGEGGWPDMKKSFEKRMKSVNTTFPYLEPLTAEKAREKMIHYQNGKLDVSYSEKFIHITSTNMLNPSICLIRVEDGKTLETGTFAFGTVQPLDESAGLYVVELTSPEAKLMIKENKE